MGSPPWVEKMQKVLGLTEVDPNVPEPRQLAWRPSQGEIELGVAEEFGVDLSQLYATRAKNNDARVAALDLIRKLTSVSATELAQQYGGVSQAAISKTMKRSEIRRLQDRSWNQRLGRLEKSFRLAK